jgi:vanillate O-demethylase ferredoxin subunit
MQMLSVRVTRKAIEADGIVSFELYPLNGEPLPTFSAGSHIDVHVRPGVTRQYSLCNQPGETQRYLIGVLRDPNSRGGSAAMHDDVHEGDVLQISEPRNHFPLALARRTLLFAGGIGVTPLLCMAEQLANVGAEFEMHYCSRSRAKTAFHRRIGESSFAERVQFHFDDGHAGQKLDTDQALGDPEPDVRLYICGPTGFITWLVDIAKARGWRDSQIHVEFFTAPAADSSGDRSFDVRIASTGQIVSVPFDQPVTVALSHHGIDIPVSCEQGVCGTCVTRVLEGEPEHRDLFFTEEERKRNDQFTPCCSRARSALLVLDL